MATIKPLITGQRDLDTKTSFLVLATMFVAMLPLSGSIPIWISLLYTFMLVWRGILFIQRKERPSAILVSIFAVVSVGVAVVTLLTELHPLYAIAILMILLGCKSLLAKTPGQWTNIIVMLPILPMAVFLTHNPAWGIGYMIAFSWLWLMTTNSLWASKTNYKYLFIQSFKIVVFTLPLIIITFYFMPRPQNWLDFISQHNSSTGMSKTVKPGDVSKVTDGKGVAFSATMPLLKTTENLYWRAYVMPNYNGTQWEAAPDGAPVINPVRSSGKKPLRYTIYMFDTNTDARIALDYTVRLPVSSPLSQSANGTLFGPQDVFVYAAEADFDGTLSTQPTQQDIKLDDSSWHPKTNQLVSQLKSKSKNVSEYINLLQNWVSDNGFLYSKEPGRMQGDWLDTFLFERHKGFCEHYASAMAYMIRKAGYPARVVAGFQGGEYDTNNRTYTVPYAAAHAWMEYWDASKGHWVRLDPTAWVAPERLYESGWDIINTRAYLENIENSWWGKLFGTLSNLEETWKKWVLDYDSNKQGELLKALDKLPWFKIIMAILVFCVSVIIFKLNLHYRWSNDPAKLTYWLRRKYAGTQYEWPLSHTPAEWSVSLGERGVSEDARKNWVASYEEIVYGDVKRTDLKDLTHKLVDEIKLNKRS